MAIEATSKEASALRLQHQTVCMFCGAYLPPHYHSLTYTLERSRISHRMKLAREIKSKEIDMKSPDEAIRNLFVLKENNFCNEMLLKRGMLLYRLAFLCQHWGPRRHSENAFDS